MKTVPLGDIAELIAGVGFPTRLQGKTTGQYPFAKVGDISRVARAGQDFLESTPSFVDDADLAELRAQPVPSGSILFAKIGEAISQNFRAIAARPMMIDNNAMAAVPNPVRADQRYLFHYLKSLDLYQFTAKTTVPALRKSELLRLPVPLPYPSDPAKSLAEQRRIAAILDKADSIRRKRQLGLDDAQGLPRALFLHTFGDAFHNPHGFPVKPLSELIIDGDSINYGVVQPGDETTTGVPIVRVGDLGPDMTVRMDGLKRIEPAIEKQYSRSRLVGDEILIGCVGSIGLIALATPALAGSNIVRAVARVRCGPSVNRIYLAWSLSLPLIQAYFKRETRTVSQPTLNIGHIEKTPVMLPDRKKQDAFAAIVDQFTSTRKRQTEATKQADGLFDSLVQLAFRGEL